MVRTLWSGASLLDVDGAQRTAGGLDGAGLVRDGVVGHAPSLCEVLLSVSCSCSCTLSLLKPQIARKSHGHRSISASPRKIDWTDVRM